MSVINTNTKALVAQESMRSSNLNLSKAMERLSTGKQINSAKDDAAGLAISNRMTSQIRGMAKAMNNVNDAISMTQTAEGAIGNIGDVLQRMRELAVQAGSGTNNDTDRASLQLEVSQLKQQIQDIAVKTNHNNIKLLDGSSKNVTIQTGTNAGDSMKVSFDSMQTKDIGVGSRAVVSSIGGKITTNVALTAGSMLVNGVAVGASLATDDNASSASAAMSAIAKVAAINRVSDLSGVYAKVETNTVSGTAMTAVSATGYVTINGVSTDYFATSTDNSLARKTVVTAINAKSAITGVTATDTGDDNLGVTLAAKDGRNITIAFNTHTDASIGLGSANTYVGSYSLNTLDGRDINISAKAGAQDVAASSGLTLGTYKSDTAMVTTYARTVVSAAPASASQGLMNANSLVLNGVAIRQALATDDTASDTTATSSTRSASAIAIAAAINASSDKTGVTATAAPNVLRSTGFTATNNTSNSILLNGVTLTVNGTTRNGMVDSINSYSSRTGVVASAWGEGVQLTAADGRNISMTGSAGSSLLTGITMGADSTDSTTYKTNYSQVTLSSSSSFTVQAGSNGVSNLENLGFRQGTFGGSDNGLKINQVDISTVTGANQALVAIDTAINTVSAAQAKTGAISNRFDSIINNLAEGSKNMQASRSRIMDTDYATETTSLAKQQIIQQAATAMLAQANQSSQGVLSLLK
jgi:flagellin